MVAGVADKSVASVIQDGHASVMNGSCGPQFDLNTDRLWGGVVLIDCMLPGETMWMLPGETMWQIVLEADRPQAPVPLMTGDPVQMKETATGSRPCIFKPFSLTDLK